MVKKSENKDSVCTENENTSDDSYEYFVPDIHECLNRYVIVNFNGRPYPGQVKDVEKQEAEILCMH
ncbi:hypothetical protein DPMN_061159 [Dreissena polymorpha]|uniref:Uncharacterized protein n=1 Tax=Dreissena polymorpha TaxID=45954 RepID=A0A9D4HIX4_DREPO|nr:hypothetical protein DPMN_061159 [Dreissena polymorpha]